VKTDREAVVADLEAGVGTMLRMGTGSVDVAVVVVEPSAKSIEVGRRLVELARERRVPRVVVVANRVRGDDDVARLRAEFPEVEIRPVPDEPAVVEADRKGLAPLDLAPEAPGILALRNLAESLTNGHGPAA
jgi:CO dehydrogenase maturation factor